MSGCIPVNVHLRGCRSEGMGTIRECDNPRYEGWNLLYGVQGIIPQAPGAWLFCLPPVIYTLFFIHPLYPVKHPGPGIGGENLVGERHVDLRDLYGIEDLLAERS